MTGFSRRLPTRLIKIGNTPNPEVHLVSSHELDPQTCRYATLSHCWGGGLPIRLLRENLEEFRSDIPWDSLPKTFQETVVALKQLNIEYVWIDALCIIQDSNEDWLHEAATMKDVYANCYLNISADASENSTGGLFRDRDREQKRPFIISYTGDSDTKNSTYCCYVDTWVSGVEQAPLKSRAWVVQESFLSPRVLHFSRDQVHWGCCERLTSEFLPDGFSIKPTTMWSWNKSALFRDTQLGASGSVDAIYSVWGPMLLAYTFGKLSVLTDRPVAISGLARAFCHFFGFSAEDYLAGLWRPKFIQQIMWCAHTFGRRIDGTIPSWSWLSLDAAIYNWCSPKEDRWKPLAELVEAKVLSPTDSFGPVLSGCAIIRAKLCKATLFVWRQRKHRLLGRESPAEDQGRLIQIGQHILRETKSFGLWMDENEPDDPGPDEGDSDEDVVSSPEDMDSRPIFILLGGARHPTSDMEKYDCLILEEEVGSQCFRRLGFIGFELGRSGSSEDGAQQEDLPDCSMLLDECFLSGDVPKHLYKDVDQDFMYTVTLV